MPSVHSDNLLIKAVKAPLSLADKLWIKLTGAVPRHFDFQLVVFAYEGPFAGAVSVVIMLFSLRLPRCLAFQSNQGNGSSPRQESAHKPVWLIAPGSLQDQSYARVADNPSAHR